MEKNGEGEESQGNSDPQFSVNNVTSLSKIRKLSYFYNNTKDKSRTKKNN